MTAADEARRRNPGCCPGRSQAFTVDDLTQLRQAQHRGLHGERLTDLLSATYELVINAVRHGGGYGTGWSGSCQTDTSRCPRRERTGRRRYAHRAPGLDADAEPRHPWGDDDEEHVRSG